MSISTAILYRRYLLTCDNCGRTETVIRSSEDPRYDEIPTLANWVCVPLASFARNEQHACGRPCAEAIAKRAIDNAVPVGGA